MKSRILCDWLPGHFFFIVTRSAILWKSLDPIRTRTRCKCTTRTNTRNLVKNFVNTKPYKMNRITKLAEYERWCHNTSVLFKTNTSSRAVTVTINDSQSWYQKLQRGEVTKFTVVYMLTNHKKSNSFFSSVYLNMKMMPNKHAQAWWWWYQLAID